MTSKSEPQTTAPDAVDVQALADASGHTLADAARIVAALEASGWELQPIPPTPAERRRQRAANKKALKDFRI